MSTRCRRLRRLAATGLALGLFAAAAPAQPALDLLTITGTGGQAQTWSVSLQVLLFMTVLSVLPALLMTMTSFTRIVIVLAILRQGLGTQQTPSNSILVGIALILTAFVMSPVFLEIRDSAVQPYVEETITAGEALAAGIAPLREFMLNHTLETDLLLFGELSGEDEFASRDEVPLTLLMPAFLTSELKTAFFTGFVLLIPFLIIDLVVASVLMSVGMVMLSPLIISLPFKIMLFVLVDGWSIVMSVIARSFVS
jgi:flagellar biosynthetic protein FliP